MNQPNKVSFGAVRISEDVISSIAIVAASEVEGVRCLTSPKPEKLGRKAKRHIKLSYLKKSLTIDVYIFVKYGYTIPKVAAAVQDNVKDAVERMTGLSIDCVNIHCTGISFTKEDTKVIK